MTASGRVGIHTGGCHKVRHGRKAESSLRSSYCRVQLGAPRVSGQGCPLYI